MSCRSQVTCAWSFVLYHTDAPQCWPWQWILQGGLFPSTVSPDFLHLPPSPLLLHTSFHNVQLFYLCPFTKVQCRLPEHEGSVCVPSMSTMSCAQESSVRICDMNESVSPQFGWGGPPTCGLLLMGDCMYFTAAACFARPCVEISQICIYLLWMSQPCFYTNYLYLLDYLYYCFIWCARTLNMELYWY